MAKNNRTQQAPDNTPATSLDVDDVQTTPPAASPAATPVQTPTPVPEPNGDARLRQGDQVRPCCPNCSTPDKPVLMDSVQSLALFTWYACPNRPSTKNPTGTCIYPRVKVPRPEQAEHMHRLRRKRLRESDISAR